MNQPAIALLGTGLMGAPIALNLHQAGFAVTVWNRTIAKTEALAAAGMRVAASPADAVATARIVIALMSDGPASADLLFGQGVADAMAPASLFVNMASTRPDEARAEAGQLAKKGLAHLDAPVSGGTKGAAAASLAIMVGGEQEAFDQARPVLEKIGRPVLLGPSGSGQLAKLANQAIVGITIGAVAEALLLAKAGGADPDALRAALSGGFADSVILQQHGQRMTGNQFDGGGKSTIQLKDMNNILAEAENLGLELPLSSQIRDRFEQLVALGHGQKDHAALWLELLARNQI